MFKYKVKWAYKKVLITMGNTKKGTKPTVKTVNFYSVLSSHVKRFSASVKN